MRLKAKDYMPIEGFFDLREFDIPVREFMKLWNIQRYLAKCEANRKRGKYKDMPNELQKVKHLSAQYQQVLFSYPKLLFN